MNAFEFEVVPDSTTERELNKLSLTLHLDYYASRLVAESRSGIKNQRTIGGFVIAVGGVTYEKTPIHNDPAYNFNALQVLRTQYGVEVVAQNLKEIPYWTNDIWAIRVQHTIDAVRFTDPNILPFDQLDHSLADYVAALDALRATRPTRAYFDPQYEIDA